MKKFSLLLLLGIILSGTANARAPSNTHRYTELNDFVIESPDQGDTRTCLFMASTGAMEILLNKRLNFKRPEVNGPTDLSEHYLIVAPDSPTRSRHWFENAMLKFDSGFAVLQTDMPYTSFDQWGQINDNVWNRPDNYDTAPRIKMPPIDTEYLFGYGEGHDMNVLNAKHIAQVKEALLRLRSPVIAIVNDTDYWHAVVITGFDDNLTGDCYQLDPIACKGKKGAFYVRDSSGNRLDVRSYEWLLRRGNSAAAVFLAK